MGLYANFKQYPLRYSDFDFKDELKLSSLLSLAQESAGASADELGFGYSVLKPRSLGFLVVHTYCELRRAVGLGETLTVETWPLPPRHVIFERDYRVTDSAGSEVAAMASRWCLADLNTFSLLPPEALGSAHARCPYRDEKAVEVPKWKLPRISQGDPVRSLHIENSHTDHYLHDNNAQYADFFLDCFSQEELKKRKISAFQIAYVKQLKAGDTADFFREDGERDCLLEARAGGELCTAMRLYFA